MDEDKKANLAMGDCEKCGGCVCSNCGKCCACGDCNCEACHPEEKGNEPYVNEPVNYS